MCDPLDFWFGNTEVVESLSLYLSPSDLGRLSLVSRRWREALNVNHIWYRRVDRGFIQLFGKVEDIMEDNYIGEVNSCLCSSFPWRIEEDKLMEDWRFCVTGGNISPCVRVCGEDGGVEDKRSRDRRLVLEVRSLAMIVKRRWFVLVPVMEPSSLGI